MVEEKKQIDEDKIVENSSEDENIGDSKKDNSEKSEVVEKEKSRDNVEKGNDNVIFVGIKPFMNYVTGVVIILNLQVIKQIWPIDGSFQIANYMSL